MNQILPFAHEMFLCWRSYYQLIMDHPDKANKQTRVENKLLNFFGIANFNAIIAHPELQPCFVYVAMHHCTDGAVGPRLKTFLGLPQIPPKNCTQPFWDFMAGIRHIICHAYQGLEYSELNTLQTRLHNLLEPIATQLNKPEQWVFYDLVAILR
jgi:hypothetical protein